MFRRKFFLSLFVFLIISAISITLLIRDGVDAVQPVLGIDLGAEFIKVGMVKYGVGVDIMLNEQSKRKTPSAVAFRDVRDRYFGETAKSLETRFPENTFRYMNLLLGQRYTNLNKTDTSSAELSPLDTHFNRYLNQWNIPVKLLRNRDRAEAVDIALHLATQPEIRYQVEELFAMLFNYLKDLAAKQSAGAASGGSWDCIIAVPAYFSQAQRQAVLDSAKIAGFNVLSLMHDSTSALLQYGISKYKSLQDAKKKHNVLLFDMGASATKVSVAQFENSNVQKKDSKTNKKNNRSTSSSELGQMSVKSVSWDKSLGGKDFDARLLQHFAKKFEQIHGAKAGQSLRSNRRALSRLMQTTQKVKEILSANTETTLVVENLVENIDYRTKITREEFHTLCADLFDRVLEPVRRAIQLSKLSFNEIDAFELIGGSSRIPLIQQRLKELVQKELGFSLNSDESIALGAAFHGANVSPFFRVKSYAISEVSPYQIDFVLSKKQSDAEGAEPKVMTLFKQGDSVSVKKTINIPRTEDFTVTLSYSQPSIPESYLPAGEIVTYKISGVQDAMANFTAVLEEDKNETEPGAKTKVQISFEITDNGFVKLDSAQATLERIVKVQLPATNATDKEEQPKFKKQKKSSRVSLKTESQSLVSVRPITEEGIKAAQDRIAQMNAYDRKKAELSRWRNSLESQLYNIRYQFLEDEDNKPFYNDQQKQSIIELLDKLDEWSNNEGQEQDKGDEAIMERLTDAFKQRVESIEALVKPIQKRMQKKSAVLKAVSECKSTLDKARAIQMLFNNMQHITIEERADVLTALAEAEGFVSEQQKKLETQPLYEEIEISPEALRARCNAANLKTELLLRKPIPPPPKPEKPAASTTSENTTAESATDKATSEQPKEAEKPAAEEKPAATEEAPKQEPAKDEL